MEDNSDFISLAAAVANVVRWLELREKHQDDRERQACRKSNDEQQPEHHVDDVESSLQKRTAL